MYIILNEIRQTEKEKHCISFTWGSKESLGGGGMSNSQKPRSSFQGKKQGRGRWGFEENTVY